MSDKIFTAKTLEEAIELAAMELETTKKNIEVEIIEKGKTAFLGIGGEDAKIRVKSVQNDLSTTSKAMEIVENLIKLTNISATPFLTKNESAESDEPLIDIRGEDSGLLIGQKGRSLAALQFLVNAILNSSVDEKTRILLDVEQYVGRRTVSLKNLANQVSKRVTQTKKSITLEPMTSRDRRIVHLTLEDNNKVLTESSGEGLERKITFHPANEK